MSSKISVPLVAVLLSAGWLLIDHYGIWLIGGAALISCGILVKLIAEKERAKK